MYSEQITEHLAHPRNVGEVENPSGVGDVTNEVCLDRIRLSIRIDHHVVTEAKIKAQGCPPTIAAASVLTELIIGRSVEDLGNLGKKEIVAALGRLPAAKMHCAALAVDALRAALADSRS
ncbi:MAG TPA: iron-sulfur cluster assembly scaffold protein [Blastocatellia bacterium]|nr:iron-sulfur cluster assembly scaffold protein [Blastocatellia bacterium]